VSNKLFAPPCD